jgi:hypothetical protein
MRTRNHARPSSFGTQDRLSVSESSAQLGHDGFQTTGGCNPPVTPTVHAAPALRRGGVLSRVASSNTKGMQRHRAGRRMSHASIHVSNHDSSPSPRPTRPRIPPPRPKEPPSAAREARSRDQRGDFRDSHPNHVSVRRISRILLVPNRPSAPTPPAESRPSQPTGFEVSTMLSASMASTAIACSARGRAVARHTFSATPSAAPGGDRHVDHCVTVPVTPGARFNPRRDAGPPAHQA